MKPFVPFDLPLHDTIDQLSFNNELIAACTNVAKFQVALTYSKINADILLNPLLLNEAVQSTKIEGTQVTFDEVLESEMDEKDSDDDVKEVLNYFKALKHGEKALQRLPIATRMFKELHKILLSDGVRGGNRVPGEFRMIQNFIGPEGCTMDTTTFVPPEPQFVDRYMANLDQYINEPQDDLHPLIRSAIIHAQFETIHPFLDGNGRIGRILIPLYLYEQKVIDTPNLFISETLEKDKHKYYRLLNDVRYRESWNLWIKFFLDCIRIQAEKNFSWIEKVNTLYERDVNVAIDLISNTNIIKIMNVIFKFPIFNVKRMTELTGVPDVTCRRYLAELENAHLIFSNDKVRGKKYYYYNLLDLIR